MLYGNERGCLSVGKPQRGRLLSVKVGGTVSKPYNKIL
jgi:hypothetical protein